MTRPARPVTYYDTAGRRLRRHGLAISRTGSEWLLDLGDGRGCRVEAPGLDEVPHELSRLVRAYSRDLELVPIPGPADGQQEVGEVSGTARAVVLGYLERQIDALARADLAVRLEQPEGVHDLRVAARRIRATLRTFAPVLGGRLARRFGEALRWLGAGVGPARDTEVQRERLLTALRKLPDGAASDEARIEAEQVFDTLAEEAAAECAVVLDSPRYLQLLNALDVLVVVLREQGAEAQSSRARRSAGKVLPELVWTVAVETDARVTAVRRQAYPNAVHAVRKSVKRLRYAVEAAAGALPVDADRVLKSLRSLQDLLGEYQDAVVAQDRLQSLTEDSRGIATRAYGLLLEAEISSAERCVEALPVAWHKAYRELVSLCG
ncbi:CHAD domain-containing protein [Amycolatopsis panacis]|uniref:CHAD domain-containing protein n=1 Tax=Amycolatopsis panacis TaxID=2340917 RepID=A0A419IB41_9PSEU|nr:CHAD domain-containing protein [Amycolatopsis panacis]RJQ91099.1 CHAD domain-containing protein [Amycolatopsis panacis]